MLTLARLLRRLDERSLIIPRFGLEPEYARSCYKIYVQPCPPNGAWYVVEGGAARLDARPKGVAVPAHVAGTWSCRPDRAALALVMLKLYGLALDALETEALEAA